MASAIDNLEALCNDLSIQIQALRATDENDDLSARRKATDVARKLVDGLIHPEEAAAEQVVALSEWASIRMFIEWKFFDKIPSDGSISYQELAASNGAEEALVSRLGQMLVATGKLIQPEPNHVAHSRLSPAYKTGDRNNCSFAMHHDDLQRVYTSLPGFFKKYGPHQPRGKTHLPITFSAGVDGQATPWDLLGQRGPEEVERFGLTMQAMPNYAWPYTGAYDFSWVEEYAATNTKRTLIIDVGGNYGHALRANLVKFPGIPPSQCAVEDRPAALPSIREEHAKDEIMKDVQKIAADFHEEQPVKGALIYFIRRCLHDYDDDDCVNILRILAEALPDDEPRARILINEQIMTDPPHRFVAAMDVVMLTWASLERSEQQFEKLASRAGLAVVKIHKAEGTTMGVVECKKASSS